MKKKSTQLPVVSTQQPSTVSSRRSWTIETKVEDNEYPDILTYVILEPNEDAGKPDVSYSGKYCLVCETDDKDAAHLIAAAPDMLDSLKGILYELRQHFPGIENPVSAAAGLKAEYLAAADVIATAVRP